MHIVTSADGTQIAYDRYGEGPAVIMVNGALGYRKFKKFEQTAIALAERHTVINYDRRGRGDSGEAGPVSVQHEVDDIAALIQAVGGQASLFGWSSGGAVALRAAAADIGVEKLVIYETPFKTDPDAKYPADDYGARLEQLVAADDRAGAAKHFMRNAVGIPGPMVAVMSLLPMFKKFAVNGHTLTFDYAALGDHNMHDRRCGPRSGRRSPAPPWSPTAPRPPADLSTHLGRSPTCSRTRPCGKFQAKTTTSRQTHSCHCWMTS